MSAKTGEITGSYGGFEVTAFEPRPELVKRAVYAV